MLGISLGHLVVLGIILLIMGPKRLPEVGISIGKALRNFKDSLDGVQEPKFKRLEDEKEKTPESKPEIATENNVEENKPHAG